MQLGVFTQAQSIDARSTRIKSWASLIRHTQNIHECPGAQAEAEESSTNNNILYPYIFLIAININNDEGEDCIQNINWTWPWKQHEDEVLVVSKSPGCGSPKRLTFHAQGQKGEDWSGSGGYACARWGLAAWGQRPEIRGSTSWAQGQLRAAGLGWLGFDAASRFANTGGSCIFFTAGCVLS